MTDQYKVYRDMPEKAKEEGIKLLQDLESKVRQEERSEDFGYLWLELREGIALFDAAENLARLYDWEEKHGSIKGPKIVLTHRRGTIIYCDPRMVPSEDSEDRKELNSLCSRWKILVFSQSDRDFMEDLLTGTVYEIQSSCAGYHDEVIPCVDFVKLDSFRGVFAKFRHAKKNGEQFFKSYKETAQRTQLNRIERRHRKYTVTGFSNYSLWKEIKQVYEKACKDEESEAIYINLENKALEEAARACREGGVIAEQAGSELWEGAFGALSANDKITAIDMMRELSISHSNMDTKSSVFSIELSSYSRENPACTVLGILSLLEGLEESKQIKNTKWRIILVCAGKNDKGIREWRDFIRELYPWAGIHERKRK